MSDVVCPGCRVRLDITDTTYPYLSCPRCLAPVPNPNLAQPPPLPPAYRMAPRGAGHWRDRADERARRDRSWTTVVLAILAGFGVLGAAVAGAQSGLWALVIPAAVWGAVVVASGRRDTQGTLARILLGVFAVAGVFTLLGIALLVFLLVTCSGFMK